MKPIEPMHHVVESIANTLTNNMSYMTVQYEDLTMADLETLIYQGAHSQQLEGIPFDPDPCEVGGYAINSEFIHRLRTRVTESIEQTFTPAPQPV